MADVPGEVQYGTVKGYFTSFLADLGATAGSPDAETLSGTVTLTPSVSILRFASTTPPQMAAVKEIVCDITSGNLRPQGREVDNAIVIASDQPNAQPSHLVWTATFNFVGLTSDKQPPAVTFEVPSGGTIDLANLVETVATTETVIVVSEASKDAAIAAQAAAEAARDEMDPIATPTQTEYDALTPDADTYYLIQEG